MIDPEIFTAALLANGVSFASGVPDTLLRDIGTAIGRRMPSGAHVIAANEGAAVGLAIGHYLATGDLALVYMQNSGLGNALNPLVSLADPAVYGVPMLLLVGWRGEMTASGQMKDEPQHVVQGRISISQLDLLGIPFCIVDGTEPADALVAAAAARARAESRPIALLVRKGSFARQCSADAAIPSAVLGREAAIAALLDSLPSDLPIVSTTGMASRELFELRKARGEGHARDFLTVGGMGHAVSIAIGIALSGSVRKILCLDGDGAMLMHMGALTEAAVTPNLIHIVLNNAAHDSVGGQPTAAGRLDLTRLAACCGYAHVSLAKTASDIAGVLRDAVAVRGSSFVEIVCRRGARADLGRPDRTPAENKHEFMAFLQEGVGVT